MQDKLQGRVAIVTGGARGIGFGIAERLARDGAHVVIADVIDDTAQAAQRLAEQGRSAQAWRLDVSQEREIGEFVRGVERQHGRIDILVNNAGISPKNNGTKFLVEETSTENWSRVIAVNLTGPFLLCRECIPVMRRQGHGRIVNITSQSARTRPEATSGHYAASKTGLMGLSRALAGEVGNGGITVNCVAPGVIETPMLSTFSDERRAHLASRIPMGAMGAPADIAAAVAFLASDDARYITGTTIDVNGGMFMT
ncbi:SDR family NAD(P)-dependent oxidoreductase [Ramlibacter algicola]|uniref:SDR family oxidoreductase n=1 Tax=Ramlibacter algicola TaxID=2795217 RepID=A0A934Q0N3_9BURK|nr:SDR family NAD(P)-dependent oxidoreductase [Ramlibacter algicola]MBK0392568.1 SDR family oxidoreductase [Ramlibacter algicola]